MTRTTSRPSRFAAAALAAALLAGTVACSSSDEASSGSDAGTLRLGYFANVTHAAAVIGVDDGTFQTALGDTKLETSVFNAGPAAIEALNSGAIDATFIGPSPAINAFAKSNGEALRVVSGATANGAELVVRDDITSIAELKGTSIATPQLGGTQDVALRWYLLQNGLKVQTTGGDDVDVVNQENAQTLDLFKTGEVDGGWLPEPWSSRLVVEAGAKVLVDETKLWPNGEFPTTILIVGKKYLDEHPDVVEKLIRGEVTVLEAIEKDPAAAQTELNAAIEKLTGKPLGDEVIARAFGNIKPTVDPIASAWPTQGEHAVEAGLLTEAPDLNGIFDLRILNKVLTESGETKVSAAGSGQD